MASNIEVFSCSGESDSPSPRSFADLGAMLGPGHVDQMIRQSIQTCWMALPKEKRTVDEVDRQIRRLVERALQNFREDSQSFGSADS